MGQITNSEIAAGYHQLMDTIHSAAIKAGRGPDDIKLVVVTKKQPIERIKAVVSAGAGFIGENYADEANEKFLQLTDYEIETHLIGHLQSRKATIAAGAFHWIETVDSLKIAQKLANECKLIQKRLDVLLEINIADESTKSGFNISSSTAWSDFVNCAAEISLLEDICIKGIMVMPPYVTDPEDSRKYFRKAKQILERLKEQFPGLSLTELSMGTSVDYQVAIAEGATIVRVGTAIFGSR